MSWGKSIVVTFVLFATFIGALVTVCIREDISLVSKEYYKEELAYGTQMERIMNTEQLASKPEINLQNGFILISFSSLPEVKNGQLKLFRPSDSRLDREFEINSGAEARQYFDTSRLPKGMYKARMLWSMNGKDYFFEKIINL